MSTAFFSVVCKGQLRKTERWLMMEKNKVKFGGMAALVGCPVVVLFMLCLGFSGCGKPDTSSSGESAGGTSGESAGGTSTVESSNSASVDTLVVKGLYVGMPGDDAVEACKKMVASSGDLVAVDFRNGIEVEREVGLENFEKKQREEYRTHMGKLREFLCDHTQAQADAAGLNNYTWEEWKEVHPPSGKDIVASKAKKKEIIAKKNLIQISFKQEYVSFMEKGSRANQLKGLCFVWIDDQDKVKELFFNEEGMAKLFNAEDLSGEEFARSLVENYSGIPKMTPECTREDLGKYGSIETVTWLYKDPKGYQVKLFERAYINPTGRRYVSDKKLSNSNLETSYYLSMAGKAPKRFVSISSIKPVSSRKFD